MRTKAILLALGAGLVPCISAHAEGDVAAGKTAFESQCAVCHSTAPGGQGFGPSLAAVYERKAGTLPGFTFTPALSHSQLTWDAKTLDAWLTSSLQKVPGTAMQVAIPDEKTRSDIIAYLETLGRTAPTEPAKPSMAALPAGQGPSQDELLRAASDKQNWLYDSKDYAGQRFVDLGQINPSNAASLRPVCIYRSNSATPTQTNLLVYKGVMFMSVDQSIVAIDAKTCRERWTYVWQVKGNVLSPTNRGVAIKDGRVIRGTADGYLIAVDMENGSLLWSRKIAGAETSQYLSMPPLIFGDLVIYGPAGGDWGSKNWVGAFKLDTGEQVWRFNLIPDANEPGAETWTNPQSREHGGGALWTPLSLDAEKGILFVPVGNPAPDFYREVRPGTDLYTDSVVALDVKTGKLLWYDKFVAIDMHDWDLSQVSPIFRAQAKGKERNLLTVSGKDGFLRMVDRDSRELLYEMPITTRKNADQEPTVSGVHICPGLLGGVEWSGPALDPKNNTLFVVSVDWCGIFKKMASPPQFALNTHYYGGSVTPDARAQAKGWLFAIDAGTGEVRWCRQWPTPLVAGLTATSGGMLFTGDLDNNFLAIDAHNGKTLYSFNTGGSIGGSVISYELDGKQYAATSSGVISGFFGGSGTSAVIIFALP